MSFRVRRLESPSLTFIPNEHDSAPNQNHRLFVSGPHERSSATLPFQRSFLVRYVVRPKAKGVLFQLSRTIRLRFAQSQIELEMLFHNASHDDLRVLSRGGLWSPIQLSILLLFFFYLIFFVSNAGSTHFRFSIQDHSIHFDLINFCILQFFVRIRFS